MRHNFLPKLFAPPVVYIYHRLYSFAHTASPADPRRAQLILGALVSRPWTRSPMIQRPFAANFRQISRVHSWPYLESLHNHEVLSAIMGGGLPPGVHDRALDTTRIMVGGTILALRQALKSQGAACSLGGGFHHARSDYGHGFCVFNDIAIAIEHARSAGFKGRILVIDLDIHDGDGTRLIFRSDPKVFTYSIHNDHWADTEAVASESIALGPQVSDSTYFGTLKKTLPPLLRKFQPDLVFYLAGCDPAHDDAMGNWAISPRGMLRRDLFVYRAIRKINRPLVVLLAGGYGPTSWRYTARFLGNVNRLKPRWEPPSAEEVLLRRFRHLASELDAVSLSGTDDWSFTEEDIFGSLGGGRKTRFLGYYTRHGIELVFEKMGIFGRLEDLGFPHPFVEVDLTNPVGDTLKVWANDAKEDLLVEVRLRKDRRLMPGLNLLRCEWLLLQNPNRQFPPDRPRLPGQKHPGLGMLHESTLIFVLICERLGLDGVVMTPRHLHIAEFARKRFQFLEPKHAAFMKKVRECFEADSLAEASFSLKQKQIVNQEDGNPIEWPVMPMVLPVTESCKKELKRRYSDYTEAAPEFTVLD